MTKQGEIIYWDWLTKESTAAVKNCGERGHCYHQGTAWDTFYCCRCGQYKPQSMSGRLNFSWQLEKR